MHGCTSGHALGASVSLPVWSHGSAAGNRSQARRCFPHNLGRGRHGGCQASLQATPQCPPRCHAWRRRLPRQEQRHAIRAPAIGSRSRRGPPFGQITISPEWSCVMETRAAHTSIGHGSTCRRAGLRPSSIGTWRRRIGSRQWRWLLPQRVCCSASRTASTSRCLPLVPSSTSTSRVAMWKHAA